MDYVASQIVVATTTPTEAYYLRIASVAEESQRYTKTYLGLFLFNFSSFKTFSCLHLAYAVFP